MVPANNYLALAAFTGFRAVSTPIADTMSGTAKIQKTTSSARSLMFST